MLAERLVALVPLLRHRFFSGFPDDLREQMSSVTPHQVEALCHLTGAGALTMHELAEAQGCAMSTATALADRLLKQKLAERVPDASDRRLVRLVPTARARALTDRFAASKRAAALAAVTPLSDEELATLVDLLVKIAGQEVEAAVADAARCQGTDMGASGPQS